MLQNGHDRVVALSEARHDRPAAAHDLTIVRDALCASLKMLDQMELALPAARLAQVIDLLDDRAEAERITSKTD